MSEKSLGAPIITHDLNSNNLSYCPGYLTRLKTKVGVPSWVNDSAVSGCRSTGAAAINSCKIQTTDSIFYHSLVNNSSHISKTTLLEQTYRLIPSTQLLDSDFLLEYFSEEPNCLGNTESDRMALTLYTQFISRLKKTAFQALSKMAAIDQLLGRTPLTKEMGNNTQIECKYKIPIDVDGKISINIKSAPPALSKAESQHCHNLKQCSANSIEAQKELNKMIEDTHAYYEAIRFLQKNILGLKFSILRLRDIVRDNTETFNQGIPNLSQCYGAYHKLIYKQKKLQPFMDFGHFWIDLLTQKGELDLPITVSKSDQELEEHLSQIWENYDSQMKINVSGSIILFDAVYEQDTAQHVKAMEYEKYTEKLFSFENNSSDNCFYTSVNGTTTEPRQPNKYLSPLLERQKDFKKQYQRLNEVAKIQLPWIFSNQFNQNNTPQTPQGLRHSIPVKASIEHNIKRYLIIEWNKLRLTLYNARQSTLCLLQKHPDNEFCTTLEDNLRLTPFYNPVALEDPLVVNNNRTDYSPQCTHEAHAYAYGYMSDALCAEDTLKNNEQVNDLVQESGKAIAVAVLTTGFGTLAGSARIFESAVMGSRIAQYTPIAATAATLGIDISMATQSLIDLYQACKTTITNYAMTSKDEDFKSYEQTTCFDKSLQNVNSVNAYRRDAGSCLTSMFMVAAFDLLPIIPSMGQLGQLRQQQKNIVDALQQQKLLNLPKRPQLQSDVSISPPKTVSDTVTTSTQPPELREQLTSLNSEIKKLESQSPTPETIAALKDLRAQRGRVYDQLPPEERLAFIYSLTDIKINRTPEIDALLLEAHDIPMPPKPGLNATQEEVIAYRKAIKDKVTLLNKAGVKNSDDHRRIIENWGLGKQISKLEYEESLEIFYQYWGKKLPNIRNGEVTVLRGQKKLEPVMREIDGELKEIGRIDLRDPTDANFNCVAHTIGIEDCGVWPTLNSNMEITVKGTKKSISLKGGLIQRFDTVYREYGFIPSKSLDHSLDPTKTKVVMYGTDPNMPTHVIIQKPNGKWESKMSHKELIEISDPKQLVSREFGEIIRVYEKPL